MMKLVEGETKIKVEWDDGFSANYLFVGYGIAPIDYAFPSSFIVLATLEEEDTKTIAANLKHIVTITKEDK